MLMLRVFPRPPSAPASIRGPQQAERSSSPTGRNHRWKDEGPDSQGERSAACRYCSPHKTCVPAAGGGPDEERRDECNPSTNQEDDDGRATGGVAAQEAGIGHGEG